MTKFALWLNSNPNMATKLAHALGVNRASISNCKVGITPMPIRWMPVVVKMSNGLLDYETLVLESGKLRVSRRLSSH